MTFGFKDHLKTIGMRCSTYMFSYTIHRRLPSLHLVACMKRILDFMTGLTEFMLQHFLQGIILNLHFVFSTASKLDLSTKESLIQYLKYAPKASSVCKGFSITWNHLRI